MRKTQHCGLTIRAAGRYKDDRGADRPLHTHPTWEVVYYLEGRARCRIGNEVLEVAPGVLLVIPPGEVHGEIAQQPWSCYYVLLEGLGPADWPLLTRDTAGGQLGQVCGALVQEWRSQRQERELMLSLLLGQLGVLLRRSRHASPPSAAERHVREFERVLEERFVERVTIAELAREVGVSGSYLRAQFVRLRGQTPIERLQQLRAQQALAMIRTSDHGLEVIADLCGYASASHLSYHIKRATGQRPGTFRTQGRP